MILIGSIWSSKLREGDKIQLDKFILQNDFKAILRKNDFGHKELHVFIIPLCKKQASYFAKKNKCRIRTKIIKTK